MNNIENTASNLGDKLVHTANNVADEIKNAAQATVDSAKQTLHNQTLTEDVSQYMHKGLDAAHDMGNQIIGSQVRQWLRSLHQRKTHEIGCHRSGFGCVACTGFI